VATKKTNSEDKFEQTEFDLFVALEQIDRKNYNWFSNLTEEQRKKFVPYMVLHWNSSVKANSEVSSYYVMSTDICANKYIFNDTIQNHPELQWLMFCASSPGIGKQFHAWIPHLSSKTGELRETVKKKDISDYLTKIFKNDSADEIDATATYMTELLNHRVKLASFHPELKLDDIAVLSNLVDNTDVQAYEKECGID
jgi:hypothetical protein